MLTGIGLRNFKAFGEGPNVLAIDDKGNLARTDTAPLSKITLIYGPNSGGKSTIIQALLLLNQSLMFRYVDGHGRRALMPKGDFVDLGGLQVMLHKHKTERELGLSIRYREPSLGNYAADNDVQMTFRSEHNHLLSKVRFLITAIKTEKILLDAVMELSDLGSASDGNQVHANEHSSLSWKTEFTISDVKGDDISHQRPVHFLPTLGIPELRRMRRRARERAEREVQRYVREHSESRELTPDHSYEHRRANLRLKALERSQDEAESMLKHAREHGMARTRVRSQSLARRLQNLNLPLDDVMVLTPENIPIDYEHIFHSIGYLGPVRSVPERLYRIERLDRDQPKDSRSVGVRGEYSANVLYHNADVLSEVNELFERFNIPYALDVMNLGDEAFVGEHIAIALTDKRTDAQVTLADVGYGINQLLPIIIEGVASQEGSVLCVEQPEIHLHPRLQANIADLMIDTIANERGKRKQWIVETHSELLILRLQRRIREGKIKPEDISVLYVDPNDESTEGSAIKVLRLGEDSYFKDPWPDGFFDDGLKERLPDDNEFESSDDDTNILDKLFSE